jgi:hypothetical protein
LLFYRANVLTGESKGLFASGDRIVGVMINNISNSARQNARPQRGLSAAKILIESKVEGGITRFCALYDTASAIPEVGPIRSGRDQFLQLIMPWKALYYHDGESIFCTQFVNVYDYSDYNLGGKSYFDTPTHPIVSHRDSRGGVVAYEHEPGRGLRRHLLPLCGLPQRRAQHAGRLRGGHQNRGSPLGKIPHELCVRRGRAGV